MHLCGSPPVDSETEPAEKAKSENLDFFFQDPFRLHTKGDDISKTICLCLLP